MSRTDPTILVVDDDPDIVRATRHILTGAGLTVVTASTAADALATPPWVTAASQIFGKSSSSLVQRTMASLHALRAAESCEMRWDRTSASTRAVVDMISLSELSCKRV